jgi:hypothetical protein
MTPLRQRMTEDMELRGLSRHTQRAYVQYLAIFAQYFHKSPELLGPAEIRAFQLYLTQERHLSPSSIAVESNSKGRPRWYSLPRSRDDRPATLWSHEQGGIRRPRGSDIEACS